MSNSVSQFEGTRPVADQQRFDVAALEAWMRDHVEGFAGPLTIEQFKGGQSNPTFKLSIGGQHYVLRTKPAPAAKLLPSAHAIEREYRVMDALQLSLVDIPPHGVVDWHDHPNEQLGMVVAGRLTFHIGDEVKTLGPGDFYCIPGGVRHRVEAHEIPSQALDIFHPIRDEYR